MIKFNGKEYPTKMLDIPDFGERLVSIESLEKSLFDTKGFYVSTEAQIVDEKIFFYVPDDVIDDDDERLTEFIEEIVNEPG
ncbi:MAG: hypothetical protein IJ709_10180 [Selenomonas sp.]|nr:hypothetical protein [Selenomonas sp.]